jgi:hypothetical protein
VLGTALAGEQGKIHVIFAGTSCDITADEARRLQQAGIQARFDTAGKDMPALVETLRQSAAKTVLVPITILSNAVQAAMMLEILGRSVFIVR